LTRDFNSFGAMMVEMGDADTMLSGIDHSYPDTIRPALQIIGKEKGLSKVHGMYMLVFPKEVVFISDATVTIDPTAEELAETTLLAARQVRLFDMEPKVAMLSFSNFGSSNHPLALKVKRATELVKAMDPKLVVDGEVQANVARSPRIMADQYPFSALKGDANLFIFPDLQSANISYKLLHKLGGAELVGPILMGMNKPVHVLQRGYEVAEIVNMAAVAVVDAQR
ncbi:MAG: NADP-dependent malic enzyme, partial [Desulfobacterales bacterium]|nr:NADP-dependent malic enzyme [Desulfobacterales bacterium]